MRVLLWRCVPRRFFDRGPYRKDYSDPGFQKLGYIDESCYEYTYRGRFPTPHVDRSSVGPQDITKVKKHDYVFTKRKMGAARKRYEEQKAENEATEAAAAVAAASKHSIVKHPCLKVGNIDEGENGRETSDLPAECAFRPIPQVKSNRTQFVVKKRGFKGMIQDYTNWTYPGSKLDEYTRMVAARKKKAAD